MSKGQPRILSVQRFESGGEMTRRLLDDMPYRIDRAGELKTAIGMMSAAKRGGDPYRAFVCGSRFPLTYGGATPEGNEWQALHEKVQEYDPESVFVVYTSLTGNVDPRGYSN